MNRQRMLLLFCLTALTLASCTDDKECPVCPTAPVSDYNVYMADQNSNKVYVYNTRAMDIVDTITLPSAEIPIDIDVSYDGSQLLVTSASGFTVYNLANMAIVTTRPYGGDIEVSWSGRYVAVVDDDSLVILDGTSYAPVLSDTIHCMNPRFSLDDSQLYCVRDSQYIRAYDIAADSIVLDRECINPYDYGTNQILCAVPTSDSDRILLGMYYYNFAENIAGEVLFYSPERDTMDMVWWQTFYWANNIRSFPSGRKFYYTCPDSILAALGYRELWNISFVTKDLEIFDSRVPMGYCWRDSTGIVGFMPEAAIVTPDEKYTITASCSGPSGFGMVDNDTYEIADVHMFHTDPKSFGTVACQKRIK